MPVTLLPTLQRYEHNKTEAFSRFRKQYRRTVLGLGLSVNDTNVVPSIAEGMNISARCYFKYDRKRLADALIVALVKRVGTRVEDVARELSRHE